MSLLYHFMDEFLFVFSAEPFFIARVTSKINIFMHISGPSSAFEKWSGHVEPKGSRMGVFMDIPEKKNWIHHFQKRFYSI